MAIAKSSHGPAQPLQCRLGRAQVGSFRLSSWWPAADRISAPRRDADPELLAKRSGSGRNHKRLMQRRHFQGVIRPQADLQPVPLCATSRRTRRGHWEVARREPRPEAVRLARFGGYTAHSDAPRSALSSEPRRSDHAHQLVVDEQRAVRSRATLVAAADVLASLNRRPVAIHRR